MADRSKSEKVAAGLADYNDVPSRLAEFKEKYPDGRLTSEFEYIRDFGGADWVVCHATAFKSPEDATPARASAWERVPGLTPYTKNSEHQNAETSAWGRVLLANLTSEAKRGIATADEIRGREAERDPQALANALKEGKPRRSRSRTAGRRTSAPVPSARRPNSSTSWRTASRR
jgi:hypothetical protein